MSRIISVIRNHGFNMFVEALEAADLIDVLIEEEPLTLFAPTDHAFSMIERKVLQELLANRELLADVLSYHVVPGYYMVHDLEDSQRLMTLEGSSLVICKDKDVRAAEAAVIQPDIKADNGVVHAVDQVILDKRFFMTYGLALLKPISDIGSHFVGSRILQS